MLRGLRNLSFIGLALTGGVWLAAVGAGLYCEAPRPITCGYAHGESWLFNMVVDGRGRFVAQYFRANLTPERGAYCSFAFLGVLDWYGPFPFLPRSLPTGSGVCLCVHLSFPVIAFALTSLGLWFVPFRRRRRRRRLGQCIHCGYDLRGATAAFCSECGKPIAGGAPAGVPSPSESTGEPHSGQTSDVS